MSSIVRYPVKSMAGESIDAGFFGFAGLFGDRSFAFTQQNGRRGFPWFTIRQMEDLVLYKARFKNPDAVRWPVDLQASLTIGPGVTPLFPEEEVFDIEVELPSGQCLPIRSNELKAHLESETGEKLSLRFSERSFSDCRPVSIFANTSLAELESEIGIPLDRRRFRSNLYVDWDNVMPFYENGLIGQILQIGERVKLMLTERDPRCKVITIDPETAEESPQILRHVSNAHKGTAGVYGAILLEGVVRVGDPIHLV